MPTRPGSNDAPRSPASKNATTLIGMLPGGEHFELSSQCSEMRRVLEYANRVARTPYPVLIQGDTGSGKEMIARGIHGTSGLSGAFVPVNCGAIPENLFEAELFGAKRGAYTGLDSDRPGLFRLADKGTLFLDEIAEMPASMQAKLLRVLQDGEIRSLGSAKPYRVEVRIVAATHKHLQGMVESGRFRMDLYFRISAAAIRVPPLRERTEDIPHLLAEAAAEAARVQGATCTDIADDAIAWAKSYHWPGNVRELMHATATAMLRAGNQPLSRCDFPVSLSGGNASALEPDDSILDLPYVEARARFERSYLRSLLEKTGSNLSRAARLAGLPRSTLRDQLRKHGLSGSGSSARNRNSTGRGKRRSESRSSEPEGKRFPPPGLDNRKRSAAARSRRPAGLDGAPDLNDLEDLSEAFDRGQPEASSY